MTAATWTEVSTVASADLLPPAEAYYTVNATLPVDLRQDRDLYIDIQQGVSSRIVVSRSAEDRAMLIVESVWSGADPTDANINMASAKWSDEVSVTVRRYFQDDCTVTDFRLGSEQLVVQHPSHRDADISRAHPLTPHQLPLEPRPFARRFRCEHHVW